MRKIIYFLCILACANLVYGLSIEISEVFSNPEGKDNDKEFIEIHNYGNLSVGLKGVFFKNYNNRTFELYDFYEEIKSYEYLVFYPEFNLKNENGNVKLLFGYDIIDELEYKASVEGMSWVKINNEWYIGKSSEGKRNFGNFTLIEHKIECLNQSIIKSETLLNTSSKRQNKVIYIKNLKQKKLGGYILILALVFLLVVIFMEYGRKRD
ncbi:MAG: lamin tail domain-containing protein [Nanoarchaeota archaeon]